MVSQQRGTKTAAGVGAAITVIGVERTSATRVGRATSAEPRRAGIHEERVGLAPRLIVARNGLGSVSFVGGTTTAGFKGTDIVVVIP